MSYGCAPFLALAPVVPLANSSTMFADGEKKGEKDLGERRDLLESVSTCKWFFAGICP